jgi:hypothetical protein
MDKPDSRILTSIEDALREKVTVKSCDVTYGLANYCHLTTATDKKFTAMFSEEPTLIVIEEKDNTIYSKDRFLVEKENTQKLSKAGIAVPAILYAGDNFIIWPCLGGNMPMDDSLLSQSNRLDIAVSGIIDCLAAIHCLPVDIIPHRAKCSRDNLEFSKNYSFLRIIASSDNTIATNIRNSGSYGRLCELIGNLSGISIEDSIIKGETYNPETVFCDGNRIHLTDYKFAGIGNPFFEIVSPVSWGLPHNTNEAVSKKQQRLRRYLRARKIKDELAAFFRFDCCTILESLNMLDVLSGVNDKKAKILCKMARRNMETLITGNTNLNEAREVLLSIIPQFQ